MQDPFTRPNVHDEEERRLARLHECGILDSPEEHEFDQIVAWASEVVGVPIALISLVDETRQWFKARCGLDASETSRAVSFCGHVVAQDAAMVIEDARADQRFSQNPLVIGEPHIVFYAGFPIRVGGLPLGTLCLIDHEPRQLLPKQESLLRGLAQQVALQLEWRRSLRASLAPPPSAALDAGHASYAQLSLTDLGGDSDREHTQARETLRSPKPDNDATELLRARLREAERLIEAQRRVIDDLEQLRMRKDRLANHVVHDLKNPLTAIVAHAYLIQDSEEHEESANDILLAADAMQRMVSDLLDLAAGEAHHLVLHTSSTHLPELLSSSGRAVGGATLLHDHTISVSTEHLVDPWLEVDGHLLQRVIQNLLDNGIKYAPPKSALRLEAWDEPDSVHLAVRDEGVGIPDAERERIFELYARAEGLTAHRRESQGLGLAFCKMAIEAHGGRIWVEDAVPAGACFRVKLPRSTAVVR